MSEKTKILIVDDDPDTLRLLSKRLRESGYQTCAAGDGVACMSAVRNEEPDLIVLDLGLPAGDGFVTLERLRTNNTFADIPVVVLTARHGAEVRNRALAAGASAFFEKTANKDEFMGTIGQLTSKRNFVAP